MALAAQGPLRLQRSVLFSSLCPTVSAVDIAAVDHLAERKSVVPVPDVGFQAPTAIDQFERHIAAGLSFTAAGDVADGRCWLLRLLVAVRPAIHGEADPMPKTPPVDELLDERLAHRRHAWRN
jgi:hypothetical protein